MFCRLAPWVVLCMCVATVQGQKSRMLPDYSDHECVRTCVKDAKPKECQYKFVVESYSTLSRACYNCTSGNITDCFRGHCITTNGVVRNVLTVNRILPGPSVQVCKGDTVVVNVTSYVAMSEGITIHWHGILQNESPYMDGVSMLTQCPIPAGSSFQYRGRCSQPCVLQISGGGRGTHLWHAHAGIQRGEGLFGSFVVRVPQQLDLQGKLYDYDLPEHVVVVNEWTNTPMDEVLTEAAFRGQGESADTILINGKCRAWSATKRLPRAVFRVKRGFRYRFRFINAGTLFCPIRISIDDHSMLLIASDGRPFERYEVGSFDMLSAERYDFVLTTVKKKGPFWIRARGLGDCEKEEGLEERAILYYVTDDQQHLQDDALTVPVERPAPENNGNMFNYWQMEARPVPERGRPETLGDSRSQLLAMDALAKDDDSLLKKPDHQFFLHFGLRNISNLHFYDPDLYPATRGSYPKIASPQVNNITNKLGPVPLLPQRREMPESQLCNSSALGDNCIGDWCECTHILRVHVGDVVEMVITSSNPNLGYTHPIHLHGFSFRVVAIDRLQQLMSPELFRQLDSKGLIARKLHLAPFKDTVALPNGGFVVIRFVADNPGIWFMHCHLEFHAEMGMAVSLEVVDRRGGLPPVPRGFPRCGPYEPVWTSDEDFLEGGSLSPQRESEYQSTAGHSDCKNYDVANSGVSTLPLWALVTILGLGMAVVVLALLVSILWLRNLGHGHYQWSKLPSFVSDSKIKLDIDEPNNHLMFNGYKH
ncbi:hypothetical protein C0Q70_21452 [Pomacea canaliculata]|uniref:Plastocyanin-like domain-containing protein n=1 Tax=Pomacea canaliculata TaxID=400727 RepID=A0A2T7NCJ0_POMCA|nr:hypothetical protein C0Q70_21452 [Pomacea canaliculata]